MYHASFVLSLSLITSYTGGQSKKMIVSGMADQAPSYHLGIGSLLVANCIELALFFVFRHAFIWENETKERLRAGMRASGNYYVADELNATAFTDMTDKENPNFEYVY
ncbi:hypothetical protein CTA2_593 [Colletotrichum tanaceti]|uniref:Uncharacterized protein n=1 Tax=Colletotrichum tanaceti TaxID=1306861 RepID=A0A4U6XMH7_9PEZI|nr:hypothetical protein CTA2_593 [Colletotrichum tanaceti]TKW56887.1 hypothetical protein CTA1_11283 [Colletotrichum tanaceti]